MNKPQPTDSFFTSINHFDEQISTFSMGTCESMIEACARQMARQKGTISAAVRLQRVADVCAGVNVMPIEHWNQKPEPVSQTQQSPAKKEPRHLLRAASLLSFGIGWLAGHFVSIVIQHYLGAQ